MAIEKMTFIDMLGDVDYLDEALCRCARSGMVQLENAARMSEYSIGSPAMGRNPYGVLLIKIEEIASGLGIELGESPESADRDFQPAAAGYAEEIHAYLDKLRGEYPAYFKQQQKYQDDIHSYTTALDMLKHVDAPDIDFDKLWDNKFLKIRFGRMPTRNIQQVQVYRDKPHELYQLETTPEQTWCLYITAAEFRDDVDAMFHGLGFERLRIPDYVHGTATDAISFIQNGLTEEQNHLKEALEKEAAFVQREKAQFLDVYTRVKFLHDAYELRKYAVVIKGKFHLVGYVLTRNRDRFVELFSNVPTLLVGHEPGDPKGPVPVPVKLKNNWFVRPFEMFVNMYGSPSYNDIDPSPFVAYTYSILFGMMFGDLGHGLCVFLLGLYLGKVKQMDLGRIMSRIGVASMFFGFWYGSVFGFEELLDPFFINVMGLSGKPIHVMHPETTNKILVATIGMGAAIILMVILFNMLIGLKQRNFSRAILSNNGLAGLVFYSSVLYAAINTLLGNSVVATGYIVAFIAIPLVLIFFKEPIDHLIAYASRESIIHSDQELEGSVQFKEGTLNIPELFTTQFVVARFGRLPIDSYTKLNFYQNEPFMLYPLKTDREYIWCIYATAATNKEEIDAIFHDLYFERIYIPNEDMATSEKAEAFIKQCVDSAAAQVIQNEKYGQVTIEKPKSIYQTMFPAGFGGFVTETFFELFEVVLSFITNTMSFLRVGGFILVHAGMMEVVFQLSHMVGGGASPVIIVVGNIFVMCMEGLIVGIQVLRLEFYEIFSRFFDAAGEPFRPYRVHYGSNGAN